MLLSPANVSVGHPVSIDSIDFSKQLNMELVRLKAPTYKLHRIAQDQGGTTLSLSNSRTLSQFKIPSSALFNFHRSYITLDVSVPLGVNLSLHTFFTDCLPIDSVQLLAGSVPLAYLTNVQPYTKVSQALAISNDEYMSRGPVYGDTVIGAARPISQITGCQPSNVTTANLARGASNLYPSLPSNVYITDVIAGGDAACIPSLNAESNVSGSDIAGRASPQRLVSSGLEAGGGQSVIQVRYRIPLKAFLGTILAMDRDLYFGQELVLEIYWKPISNWGFDVGTIAGAASTEFRTTGAVSATLTASNMYLFLAEDINSSNVSYYRNKVNNSGFDIIVPYTNCSQISTTASTSSFSMQTILRPRDGIALKRCITIPLNVANTTKRTANNFNVGGVKFTQNQSLLDSKPLQNYYMVFANSDLWNYHYELIKNSPAGMSQRTFEECCFMLDNFSDADSSVHFYDNDCKESGLKVHEDIIYENRFGQSSTGGLVLVQYQTWCRMLSIRANSVEWK